MRETKVRAWDKVLKQFVYIEIHNGRLDLKITSHHGMPHVSDLDDWKQYTGLLDKNGVEIYESDILASTYIPYDGDPEKHKPLTKTSVVKFGKILGNSSEVDEYVGVGYVYPYAAEQDLSNCEVIGNIYENKELLN